MKTVTQQFKIIISSDKKNFLKNAADLSGRTLADFVVDAAYEAAVHVIEKYQQLHLSIVDRDIFMTALLNPSKPSARLLKATKVYKKDIVSK